MVFYLVCGAKRAISFVCDAQYGRRLNKEAKSTLVRNLRVACGK